ncbi:MAG: hypothetical protein WD002_15470 [Pseudomonadales bacterium]
MSSKLDSSETITIADRFRGPPRSGNGGYVGGRFAALLGKSPDEPVEVTLRSPVLLDEPMTVTRQGPAHMKIMIADQLIAEITQSNLGVEIPEPPTYEQALAVQSTALSLQRREGSPMPGARGLHPICFCCGADHEDGLQVFAAAIDQTQVVAAWPTKVEWGDDERNIPAEYLWTALDCPGQIAYAVAGIRTGLLGRITAAIHRPAPAGENYVVTAWPVEVDGKKHFAGSAIFDTDKNLIASALSIWIGRGN